MEQIKLNFFGEIVSIDIPKDLSSLRKQIAKLYSFSEQDASEILLTYKNNKNKEIISNDEELKTFLNSKNTIIDLDISQKSQIYQNSLNELLEETEKDKKMLEELLLKKEELKKMEETKFASEKQQLKELKDLINDLKKRKKEIKGIIYDGQKQLEKEKFQLEKKIIELQKKLGLPVSKPECPKMFFNKIIPKNQNIIRFAYPCHMNSNNPFHGYRRNFFSKTLNEKNEKFYPTESFNSINTTEENEIKDKKEIHFGFICDGCGMAPIVGKRYKCEKCPNFDYCEACYEKNKNTHKHGFKTVEKSIFKMVNNERRPKREERKEIHFGFVCDGCEMSPIIGKRYKCKGCKDFDYCEKCFEKNKLSHGHEFIQAENPFHKFEKKEIHHFVICDGCEMNPIIGKRYKCNECKDFDYCEKCYEKHKLSHGHEFTQVENPFHKSEKKEIHHSVICDGCEMSPIIGKRYKCKECKDFDYCEKCYEKHKLSHGHEFTQVEKPEFKNPFLFGMNPFLFNKNHNDNFRMNPFLGKNKNENFPKEMHHCPTMGNLMNKNNLENKKVHFGVKCDGCGVFPIVGCRYKCGVCDNFDYCEECEKKLSKEHGHPLLKIRDPGMKIDIIKNQFKK